MIRVFTPYALLLVCFFPCPFSFARGALDPETDKPYHLQVVLRIAENRLLTPVFRDQVERQIGDSLRAALGDLAKVEIVHQHPLLGEVEAKGLQLALDSYSLLSDTKTHFVLIDFVDGRYEIQARQHDGFTGLCSPLRRSATADRQLVARSATLLIDQDFGLAGTVEQIEGGKIENGKVITIKLKGGTLGTVGYWLQKDQVLAVTQIIQSSAQQRRSFRVDGTLLRVDEEPRGEVCRCRLLSRWSDPLPQGPSVLGYRCVKLGTTEATLRLRVVKKDDKLRTPVLNAQVRISTRSFDFDDQLEKFSTRQDGLVKSATPYKNVAFVGIFYGEKRLARVPVEIIEGETITCPVDIGAETTAQGEWLHRRGEWLRRVKDGLDVANDLVTGLNAPQSSESALERAQAGLQNLQGNLDNLTTERDKLRAEGATVMKGTPLKLTEGEGGLKQLEELRDKLQGWVAEMQANVAKEKSPERQKLKQLVAQAKLLEKTAELDKAIELYKRVRDEGGDSPDLRKKIEELVRAHTPKNDAHAKAQQFIYETWPKLETAAQITDQLDKARKAFETCKEAEDVWSSQKLVIAYSALAARLEKEADALRPQEKEDDRKTAQLIIELADKLKDFNEQVKEYLRKAQPAK